MVFLLPALPALIEFGAAAIQVALAIIACLAAYEAAQMIANDETIIVPASSLPQQGEVVTAPVAAATAATIVSTLMNIFDKEMAERLSKRYRKPRKKQDIGVQYELYAVKSGLYKDLNKKCLITMKPRDTWKYGETLLWKNGKQRRYSKPALDFILANNKLIFEGQIEGTKGVILAAEYVKIVAYKACHNDERPPGNASPQDR